MELKRETYLSLIRPYYESDIIKVITGVRRAGKSILLATIKDEIISSGISADHIIYINLEDITYDYIQTASDLNIEVKQRVTDDQKYYLFIDEVQHVDKFEKALASFKATMNISIFVTGSNSTLLAGELATLLTGRCVEFEILPFSFFEMKEYYALNNMKFNENDAFLNYLKWGGLPQRFDYHDDSTIQRYLSDTFQGIINKDIIGKMKAFDKKAFKDIAQYVLANAGKELSVENIIDSYAENNRSLSKSTVYSYIDKMKKAYLIHGVGKYDIAGKRSLKNKNKLYAIDMGFRIISTNTVQFEDTFFLENVIYNELLSRNYTVYIGKTYKGEVDFIAIKNGKKCFIQVSYLLASEDTIKREFGAYDSIKDASMKYVLSLDPIDMSRNGITHMNILDFLLHRKDLVLS